ncbi:MAG: Ig-like domain-containing protein [Trueperaceae bacterium]|nr:Ig-like domain-containing protein [Trueperaceae bacterium]
MRHYLIAFITVIGFLVIGLSACNNTKEVDPGGSDPLSVSLAADKLISNKTITLTATVEGEPDALELWLNDNLAENLEVPYTYTFDPASDGVYSAYAKASKGSKTVTSNVLSLTVDRTPPAIVNRSPEPDSAATDGAISVSFSEAIDPASLEGKAVQVVDVRQGTLSSSAKLNEKVLSISLAEAPVSPTRLRLELSDISDLAGNTLSDSWSWSVPGKAISSFALLGERSLSSDKTIKENPSRIAANDAGNIAVVWLDAKTVRVKTWSGTAWTELPALESSKEPFRPDIALLSSGLPVVSWQNGTETDPSQGDIEVARWNGSSWESLGTVDTAGFDAAAPAIAIDASNMITVAWFEYDGSSSNVMVKRFDGTDWVALGGPLDKVLGRTAAYPSIALDYAGKPYVAWFEARFLDPTDGVRHLFVKTWTGAGWESLGEELNISSFEAVTLFSIAVGGNGNPVVAFSEFENLENSNNVYVKQWTGASWELVGEPVDLVRRQRAIYPTIVADAANGLSVAWWEGVTAEGSNVNIENDIYFAHWTGSEWQQFGEMEVLAASEGRYPDLALAGPQQLPVLNWTENTQSVYVKLAQ